MRNGRRLGERMPVRPVSTPSALDLVRTASASGGHPLPGGDSRSALFPVDDAHQARTTEGVGGSGMT